MPVGTKKFQRVSYIMFCSSFMTRSKIQNTLTLCVFSRRITLQDYVENLIFFSLYRKQFYEEKGRRRDTTQRSPQCFCRDYHANPRPRPSITVILSQPRYNKANLIVKLTYCAI